jgi:hypothetical protein
MNRRDALRALLVLGAGTAAAPLTVFAQAQTKARHIGFLTPRSRPSPPDRDAFSDAFYSGQGPRLVAASLKHRMPTISIYDEHVRAGCLMSYGQDVADFHRQAATYVDKILKGAKPADLPVEQPTKLELAVNAKTAKALGLTIPPSLLLRADEVIQ